jgi:hypothetical protein
MFASLLSLAFIVLASLFHVVSPNLKPRRSSRSAHRTAIIRH